MENSDGPQPYLLAALFATAANAASFQARVLPPPAAPGKNVAPFVAAPIGLTALAHVRVIDGTGAAAKEDQTLIIAQSRIAAVQPASAPLPSGARVIDLKGASVLPGLVGMHDHLFYIAQPNLMAKGSFDPPLVVPEMAYSAPRLYLAGGVTTLRTTGSVEPYADLNLKQQIDDGLLPGPHPATFSCCRIAQTCLALSGGLGPMMRPGFQGCGVGRNRSRWVMACSSEDFCLRDQPLTAGGFGPELRAHIRQKPSANKTTLSGPGERLQSPT